MKDTIRTAKTSLISKAFSEAELDVDCTSGTTHTRTEFYRDRACGVARVGRQWGILEHSGYRPGDRRGLIWGMRQDLSLARPRLSLKARFRRFASSDEVFYCSVISHDDMFNYHARLRSFRPKVLYGYPTAIEQFGKFIQEEGLPSITVERIFCTAERLHPAQRALLQEVFSAEVFNLYCTREHGCVGFECHKHRGFHIDVGSVLVEILNERQPVSSGIAGEVVVTDLLNYGMPFIRYAIGDIGALSFEPCDCGCPLPILSTLDGRVADLLYRPDGSVVVGNLLSNLFTGLRSTRRVQFVQEEVDSLDVYLVLDAVAALNVQEEVVRRVGSIMGSGVTVRVHPVADIPRNPRSGKFQEVICRISEPHRTPLSQSCQ